MTESSDFERQLQRELRKGDEQQSIENDDAALLPGKADVLEFQPSCDECHRPADGRRVGLRCAGYDFYLPLNLCLDCQTRIGAAIKRKLNKSV